MKAGRWQAEHLKALPRTHKNASFTVCIEAQATCLMTEIQPSPPQTQNISFVAIASGNPYRKLSSRGDPHGVGGRDAPPLGPPFWVSCLLGFFQSGLNMAPCSHRAPGQAGSSRCLAYLRAPSKLILRNRFLV